MTLHETPRIVLASCIKSMQDTTDGFDYDPDAATTKDYAADVIRHLAKAYNIDCREEGFWNP